MSERKTRGRQRIPIRLIDNKDDLLVSFSKRRVGVYKKASELSTLCGVDVGAIIFSPSGIPHSFFTPDFDSVVYGRGNPGDCYGRVKIHELNRRLDEAVEQQEREERREKQLAGAASAAELGWWEVPVDSLSLEEVKEQMEWFQTLKAQIKTRVHELKSSGSSAAAEASPPRAEETAHIARECFFAPPSLDGYDGGCRNSHVGDQYSFTSPPPPPCFDVGGGSSVGADQYLFPPHRFDQCVGGGSEQYCFPAPPSLNLFGGGGMGHVERYFYSPAPPPVGGGMGHCLGDGSGYVTQNPLSAAAEGREEATAPTRRESL